VEVKDRLEGQELVLERAFDLPAGRVQPGDYVRFQEFTRAADEGTHRDIFVNMPKL
jgi:hypothetical protein